MAKIIPITEHFQHFVQELKESFWGDCKGRRSRREEVFRALSERQRDLYMVSPRYASEEPAAALSQRVLPAGFRDPLRHPPAAQWRAPGKRGFLPEGLEVSAAGGGSGVLIREAFLRGISTRQVGRVVSILTGEVVSAQTVSRLTRELDQAVREFHQARLRTNMRICFWTE